MVVIMAAQTQDGQNVLILTAAPCTKVFNSFYHSMITSERDLIVWKASWHHCQTMDSAGSELTDINKVFIIWLNSVTVMGFTVSHTRHMGARAR